MKFSDRLENIFAVCLLVFFLFPWVSIFIVSFNGFELPGIFRNAGMLAGKMKGAAIPASGNVFYILYMIPILSVTYLFFTLKMGRNIKAISITLGLIPSAVFLYALSQIGGKMLDVVGIGAWLSILSGIGMVLAALGVLKKKQPAIHPPVDPAP